MHIYALVYDELETANTADHSLERVQAPHVYACICYYVMKSELLCILYITDKEIRDILNFAQCREYGLNTLSFYCYLVHFILRFY